MTRPLSRCIELRALEHEQRIVARIKARIEAAAFVSVILTHLDEEDYGPDCWWARAIRGQWADNTVGYTDKQVGEGWGVGPISALDRLALSLGLPDEFTDEPTEELRSTHTTEAA
jgi:hypothetical protein